MSLEIEFNKPDGKYTAGDVISGNVIIRNDVPIEVTGLKIDMFIHSKFIVSTQGGIVKTQEWTPPSMMENLTETILEDKNKKSKILDTGSHSVPFSFPALPTDFSFSFEGGEGTFCRHFLKAELDIKYKGSAMAKEGFEVAVLKLDDNPAALGWQTQSLEKHPNSSSKRVEMKVILPTGIGRQESVPIHISIKNTTKNPQLQVRTRLVRTYLLPKDFDEHPMNYVVNHSYEDFEDIRNGSVVHYLDVDQETNKCSHSGPVTSETYEIQVEVQTSETTLLRLNFPVIVSEWRDVLARQKLEQ